MKLCDFRRRIREFDPEAPTPETLWSSPHLVIEADVLRTYGVVATPSAVDLDAFQDVPLPKYATGATLASFLFLDHVTPPPFRRLGLGVWYLLRRVSCPRATRYERKGACIEEGAATAS